MRRSEERHPGVTGIALLVLLSIPVLSPPGVGAVAPDGADFTLIERAAGPVRFVAVLDRYAYVGVAHKLVVFDVLDARRPQRVSESPALPAQVEAIAVTGQYAYVAAGEAGLFIYDIASPAAPVLVGSLATPGTAQDVAVVGSHAYVTAHAAGVRIVDVSDVAVPVEVGSYANPGFDILHIDVDGTYAYVTTSPSGLHVLDVADPGTPTEIGSTALPGSARGLTVGQQHAYVAAGSAGLRIVDVSNPRQPREAGSSTKRAPEDAYDVAVAGDRAYVADRTVTDYDDEYDAGGLRVVDVSSPAKPVQLGTLTGDILSVGVRRGRAYVAQSSQLRPNGKLGVGSFDVVDVKDPAKPRRTASFSIPPRVGAPLVAGGTMLYTGDDRLRQFDLSDPKHPRLTWSLALSVDTYFRGQLTGLAIGGTYAYVGGGTSGLHVVDLANPESPRLATTLSGEAYTIAVRDNLVFVGELYGGVRIVDATNPKSPRVVGRIRGDWSVEDMQAVGDYLYVVNYAYPEDSALLIYDIRHPEQPVLAGSFSTGDDSPLHVAIAGGYAYLAVARVEDTLLTIVDVSDPAGPRRVAELAVTSFPVSDMALAGNSIYLTVPAIPGGGLRVVDVSDPTAPRVRGEYVMSAEFATAVAVLPGEIVALGSSEGLLVLRETRP